MNNSRIFAYFLPVTLIWFGSVVQSGAGATENNIHIRPIHDTHTVFSVSTQLEGRGAILMSAESDETSKLQLDARFRYDERLIGTNSKFKSIRDYESARAEIHLGDGSVINELKPSNRLIISQFENDARINIASVRDALSQDEFELINAPASTLIAPDFFAQEDASIGKSWSPDDVLLARFLNIDDITENHIELNLAKYKNNIATIHITGHAIGTLDGASTEFLVNGTARFDCNEGQLQQIKLTLNQQRTIGLLAPGLEAVFKIETNIKPSLTGNSLSDAALTSLRASKPKITDLLRLEAESGAFSLTHSRKWRVVGDRDERTVLRLIDNNKPVGQVDIMALPPLTADRPQTLDSFQQSILNKLGKNTKIETAKHSETSSGMKLMRVEAKGEVQEIPLTWIYYVINHDDGRRLQLIFTTEPHQSTEFGNADQAIINSIVFADKAED